MTLFVLCSRSAKSNAKSAITAYAAEMQTTPFRQLLTSESSPISSPRWTLVVLVLDLVLVLKSIHWQKEHAKQFLWWICEAIARHWLQFLRYWLEFWRFCTLKHVKAMLHEAIFLATCNATKVALQVGRKNSHVTPHFATAIIALQVARIVE